MPVNHSSSLQETIAIHLMEKQQKNSPAKVLRKVSSSIMSYKNLKDRLMNKGTNKSLENLFPKQNLVAKVQTISPNKVRSKSSGKINNNAKLRSASPSVAKRGSSRTPMSAREGKRNSVTP